MHLKSNCWFLYSVQVTTGARFKTFYQLKLFNFNFHFRWRCEFFSVLLLINVHSSCTGILWISFYYSRFYDEDLDETIETISCDKITKEEFKEKYVRQRIAVKIVGCVDQSDLSKFSVDNLLDVYKKSGTFLEGKILKKNQETKEVVSKASKDILDNVVNIQVNLYIKLLYFKF